MITHCGSVWGSTSSSYLYVILTDEFAYIGETGNLPPARWGMHLSKSNSSFKEKLRRQLEFLGLPPFDGEFLYIGLFCEDIDKEIESKRKFSRLALENAIHQQFILNGNLFWPPKQLLSRSSRSSSRIIVNFDVNAFAKAAVSKMANEYARYVTQLSRSGIKYEQYGFVNNLGERAHYAVPTCIGLTHYKNDGEIQFTVKAESSIANCSYSYD